VIAEEPIELCGPVRDLERTPDGTLYRRGEPGSGDLRRPRRAGA
jgi:hypothetical protein